MTDGRIPTQVLQSIPKDAETEKDHAKDGRSVKSEQ
jgi:hypothetical protein